MRRRSKISIRMTEPMEAKLRELAGRFSVSVGFLVRTMIEDALKSQTADRLILRSEDRKIA